MLTRTPIQDITQGMDVYDVNGNGMGRITYVTPGDRSTEAPVDPDMLPANLDGSDFDSLMADGFIRIENRVFSGASFASLLDVDRVTSDAVHLLIDQREVIRI